MTAGPDLALGIDGGGTGCRAILADASCRVIGRGTAGPANINSDPVGALAAIQDAAAQALGGRDACRVAATLGLAGAEVSGAGPDLAAQLPFGRVQVVQDAATALAGALGDADSDGIVAAIGTGSVFARRLGGRLRVIGGRGPILGDEAGGNWLGRRLLTGALRAADGLAPMGALVRAVLDRHGGIGGVIRFAATATPADFGAGCALLLAHPGDPLTDALLAEADAQIGAYLAVLQQDAPTALPVALTGGLAEVFAPRLSGAWPLRPAAGTALDGALTMAQALRVAP